MLGPPGVGFKLAMATLDAGRIGIAAQVRPLPRLDGATMPIPRHANPPTQPPAHRRRRAGVPCALCPAPCLDEGPYRAPSALTCVLTPM